MALRRVMLAMGVLMAFAGALPAASGARPPTYAACAYSRTVQFAAGRYEKFTSLKRTSRVPCSALVPDLNGVVARDRKLKQPAGDDLPGKLRVVALFDRVVFL